MALLAGANVTHVSYILILYSFAFVLYLFVNVLLHLYAVHAWPDQRKQPDDEAPQQRVNHVRAESRVREAEEFELDGLMSDDDEESKPLTGANGHANGTAH